MTTNMTKISMIPSKEKNKNWRNIYKKEHKPITQALLRSRAEVSTRLKSRQYTCVSISLDLSLFIYFTVPVSLAPSLAHSHTNFHSPSPPPIFRPDYISIAHIHADGETKSIRRNIYR